MNYNRILKATYLIHPSFFIIFTFFTFLTLFIFPIKPLYAQKTHDEILQQFLEQRKRMMEEIMKSFDNNIFDNDDKFFKDLNDNFDKAFDDDVFKRLRKKGFGSIPGFEHSGQSISIEEKVSDDGSILIIIKPKSKDMKLDIQTTDEQIIIKAESVVKEDSEMQQGKAHTFFQSSTSRSVSIPQGYKALPAEAVEGGLQIRLVHKDKSYFKQGTGKVPRLKKDKIPVGKRAGEETI